MYWSDMICLPEIKSSRPFPLIEVSICFRQSIKFDQSNLIGLLNKNEICDDWFVTFWFRFEVLLLELAILALMPWKKCSVEVFGY